jgi:HTH-type transcriptional regulator / antitoxin HipB
MARHSIPYEELRERILAKSGVREAYDALEPAYQIACRRIEQGMTQAELAERAGMKQPNVARLEAGKQNLTLGLLQRLAAALGCRLEVRLVPQDGSNAGPCAGSEHSPA